MHRTTEAFQALLALVALSPPDHQRALLNAAADLQAAWRETLVEHLGKLAHDGDTLGLRAMALAKELGVEHAVEITSINGGSE